MNFTDFLLCLESNTEPNVAKWGGHHTKNHKLRGGGHRTYFLDWGTIGVKKNIYWKGDIAHILTKRRMMIGVGTLHNIWVGTPHNIGWGHCTALGWGHRTRLGWGHRTTLKDKA